MSTLTFWVEGRPVPKERPRTVRVKGKSGKSVTFTPKRTSEWENLVRLVAQSACSLVKWKPEPGRYVVELEVHRAIRAGDADNHAKSLTDAMNGVVYPDDASIVGLHVALVDGEKPGARVRVTR